MDYWGWKAISARMGYSSRSLQTWITTRGFPVLSMRQPGAPTHRYSLRPRCYTNDELILRWQMSVFAQQRKERISRREQRRRAKADAAAHAPTPAELEEVFRAPKRA